MPAHELRQFLLYRITVYAIFGAMMVAYWIGALLVFWILSKLIEAVGILFLLVAIAFTILWWFAWTYAGAKLSFYDRANLPIMMVYSAGSALVRNSHA